MKNIKDNFLRTIPIMTGYIVLGMGFGIVLGSKGYGIIWSLLMSIFIYAGSMQYVGVDLISSGAGLIAIALTTVMVNARHIFYGISMMDRYKKIKKARPYLIFGLTDETYSLVCQDTNLTEQDLFQITLMNQCYWVLGCVLGSLVGIFVPWDFTGIDFVLTALFVCIFTEQWLSSKDHVPALIGVGASLLCLIAFGKEKFLIPAMLLITLLLMVLQKLRKEKTQGE